MARRRHVPGVERALRARPLARRDGRRGPRPRLVRHPAPHRGRDPARGTTSPPACTATSSGTTGRPPSRAHGLPDCRWTPCYDCGVCTDYALEHVVASAVPPAGGSQGTGQGLGFGARSGRAAPVPVELVDPMRGDSGFPVRMRFAKRGKVRFISHRDVARAFERAFRIEELPARVHPGVLAPARRSASGWRSRSATRATPSTSTSSSPSPSTPNRSPSALTAGAARGHRRHRRRAARRPRARAAGIGHRGPVPCRGRRRSSGGPCRPTSSRPRRRAPWPATSCAVTRTRKGKESVDDLRPALRDASRSRHDGDVPGARAHRCRRNPAVPGRVRCSTPSTGSRSCGVGLTEHRVLRTAPMDRTRRRAAGAAGRRRVRARPGGERIMREGTDVRRDDPGGDRTLGPDQRRQRRSDPTT